MAAITKIEIEGFKAFPKYFSLELGDKNLLIYGENGSGKSSIYFALHALLQSVFKDDKGAKYFKTIEDSSTGEGSFVSDENLVNIYRSEDVKKNVFQPYIKITLNNGHVWKLDRGGLQSENGTDYSEIKMMNKNSVFINHSYISRFHAARNSEDIDLWNVFYKDILPFYLPNGRDYFLATKYDEILEQSKSNPALSNKAFLKLIDDFNGDLYSLINNANKEISLIYNSYFKNIDEDDLEITLCFYSDEATENVSHHPFYLFYGKDRFGEKINKSLCEPMIGILIKENGQEIFKPQTHFNEAKLTAIALAVRFACLNRINVGETGLMALDDMLISLDMSNRLKVINYLLNVVVDKYKIYLFTHDKYFFEYLKHKSKKSSSQWIYKEIYMQDTKEPYLRESKTYLDNADFFIKQHEYDIAGNFLRKEAEAFCKEFLPKKLHFTADYSLLDLCGLIGKCKKFAEESGMADTTLFDELDDQRKFVLNPASHDSYDVVKYEHEVKKCFDILTELCKIQFRVFFRRNQKVSFTLKTPTPDVKEYKFEITICDDIRLIVQNGHNPILSKGMINYVVTTDGIKGDTQSKNTTLKKFYDKVFSKSDKTVSADFFDSIIDVATGNSLRSFI
jgi:ABC-type dipeptide/oligopeptide/nickel transport system ATPase subunit